MLVTDREDVAETFGDEQRGEGPLAFDHGIRHDGGRVDQHVGDGGGGDARFLQHRVNRGEATDIEALGRGQRLVDKGAAARVAQHDIGERAADVDGHGVVRHSQAFLGAALSDNMF